MMELRESIIGIIAEHMHTREAQSQMLFSGKAKNRTTALIRCIHHTSVHHSSHVLLLYLL